jgi:tetrapyrrole methylase family protein / MazG family protein
MSAGHTVTVVGLGPGDMDGLSLGALRVIEQASRLLVRTERHPVVAQLRERGIAVEPLDGEYEAAPDFATLYRRLAERVLAAAAAGDVVYAVPGHPLIGERSVSEILRLVGEASGAAISVHIVPSPGFLDAVLPALARADVTPPGDVFDLRDAAAVDAAAIHTDIPTFFFQVYAGDIASALKLALLEEYPEDHPVHVVRWAGVPRQEAVVSLSLYELDRPAAGEFDHLTTLYVPAVAVERRRPALADLVSVTARLRAPDGCPWDREQSFVSLKRYMIEEAYEAVEAVDGGDPAKLCDELGDVLFQVIFNAQLAREEGLFDIRDVIAGITEKLIRRHTWVFGDDRVADATEALQSWEANKKQEQPERTSILDGVPRELPALMKALEVSKRVVKVGFEWPALDDVFAKLDEEIRELREALPRDDREEIAAEIGDLLFTVVNIARFLKIDAEEALRSMVLRFGTRFRLVEQMAAGGKPLQEMTPAELDVLWERAKTQLR